MAAQPDPQWRTLLAGLIMGHLIADPALMAAKSPMRKYAKLAVEYADALLLELAQKPAPVAPEHAEEPLCDLDAIDKEMRARRRQEKK